MIEVEIKLQISSIPELKNKLVENGYMKGKTVKETDVYFNGETRDFRKTDEAFRIRKQEILGNENAVKTYMTYKGNKLSDISMTRKELETEIWDYDTAFQIFQSLGLKPVHPVIKLREYYHKDEISACVDEVEGLGSFLELEICIEDNDSMDAALDKINLELQKLGHSIEETTRTSYLSMLEHLEQK